MLPLGNCYRQQTGVGCGRCDVGRFCRAPFVAMHVTACLDTRPDNQTGSSVQPAETMQTLLELLMNRSGISTAGGISCQRV